ncbi:MAG: nitroreductase family protein [Minisyncoccales bacterium]
MKDKILALFGRKKGYEEKLIEEFDKSDIKQLIEDLENCKRGYRHFILDSFKTRRSIRKFNPERKIPFKDIHDILDASMNAPCAANIQGYKFILIENNDKKLGVGKRFEMQNWIADASHLILVLRDDYHVREMFPDSGETLCVQGVAALIENILLLVHMFGYGACWVAGNNNELVKNYLGVPSNMFLEAVIPVGFPLEDPKIKKETLNSKLSFEEFGNKIRGK